MTDPIRLDVLPACDRSGDYPYDYVCIGANTIRANAIAADPEAARVIVAAGAEPPDVNGLLTEEANAGLARLRAELAAMTERAKNLETKVFGLECGSLTRLERERDTAIARVAELEREAAMVDRNFSAANREIGRLNAIIADALRLLDHAYDEMPEMSPTTTKISNFLASNG